MQTFQLMGNYFIRLCYIVLPFITLHEGITEGSELSPASSRSLRCIGLLRNADADVAVVMQVSRAHVEAVPCNLLAWQSPRRTRAD